MRTDPKLHEIAAAMADGSRARMLCTLMDGRSFTAKELAVDAGISPQTASVHLARLRDVGLIVAERRGRCVYHRLAGEDVADMLETVGRLAPLDHLHRARRAAGVRRDGADALFARCCYNHLAGTLGVTLHEAMRVRGYLEVAGGCMILSVGGRAWARDHALDLRAGARACLDWSERRMHLAGPMATDLLSAMLAREWLVRGASGRALRVSETGRVWFGDALGLHEDRIVTL